MAGNILLFYTTDRTTSRLEVDDYAGELIYRWIELSLTCVVLQATSFPRTYETTVFNWGILQCCKDMHKLQIVLKFQSMVILVYKISNAMYNCCCKICTRQWPLKHVICKMLNRWLLMRFTVYHKIHSILTLLVGAVIL